MPQIQTEIFINAPLGKVYETAKNIEAFPEFLDDISSVKILERTESVYISEWVGGVEVMNSRVSITWTEEDIWDDEQHICTFKALSGNWENYDGVWKFEEKEGGTLMSMDLLANVNVPLIGPIIINLVGKLTKSNIDNMFLGLKNHIENN